MLRSSMFKSKTITIITHRINTVLDSDRTIVLDKGRVFELESPAELVIRKRLFYELVQEAGLLNPLDPRDLDS
jgi:ATP-binding cassette subfamily C (CFTR/MRP) protein 1